jgi:hypothetical protein
MEIRSLFAISVGLGAGASSMAAETVTYTYDALGRLVTSTVSSGPNSGLNTALTYDGAGNRTALTVTGSTNPGARPIAVVELPLPGPIVIPILNPNNR